MRFYDLKQERLGQDQNGGEVEQLEVKLVATVSSLSDYISRVTSYRRGFILGGKIWWSCSI